MDLLLVLLVFGLVFVGVLFVVFVLIVHASRSTKSAGESISPVGSDGIVSSELSPYGAVLVNGVLWAAIDLDNSVIQRGERVKVVQTRDSALAVRVLQKS
jgi:membrane-bound ClpP family serine protease